MFLKPIMLAGLGAAVIPLLLHLLNKARYQSVGWGAMMFLEPDDLVRPHRGTRLKQLTILLFRTAMLVTLALAMARPVWRTGNQWQTSAGNGLQPATPAASTVENKPLHAVIIMDCSASMGLEDRGRTRLAAAKQAAINVLSNFHRGDAVSVIFTGDGSDETMIAPADDAAGAIAADPEATADLQSVASRIEAVNSYSGSANIGAALEHARQIILRQHGWGQPQQQEVYLICDQQAVSWQSVTEEFCDSWRAMNQELEAPVRFFVIPVGSEMADNVAIEDVVVSGPAPVRGMPTDVSVHLRNYGAIPRSQLPLSLLIDDRPASPSISTVQMNVNLAPDARLAVTIPVSFPNSGSHVLSARINTIGLVSDDLVDRAIDVLDPIHVLIVASDLPSPSAAAGSPSRASVSPLSLALAPFSSAREAGTDPAVVRTIGAADISSSTLDRQDVLILNGGAALTDDAIRQIEQFVYGGGGLWVAASHLTDPDTLDEDMYRDGEGCLPAALAAVERQASTSLKDIDVSHPVFHFRLHEPGRMPDASVSRHLAVLERAADSRVLASYADGVPFLIERPFGRGRVLLSTTSIGMDWNSLPATDFYLPFVQSAVRYLAGASVPSRNLKAGEAISLSLDYRPLGQPTVVLPSGQRRIIPIVQAGARWNLTFRDTQRPGRYILEFGGRARPVTYVISSSRDESDLHPLTPTRWDALARSLGFQRMGPDAATLRSALVVARVGEEAYLPLLIATVVLALGEMFIARVWGRAEQNHPGENISR